MMGIETTPGYLPAERRDSFQPFATMMGIETLGLRKNRPLLGYFSTIRHYDGD